MSDTILPEMKRTTKRKVDVSSNVTLQGNMLVENMEVSSTEVAIMVKIEMQGLTLRQFLTPDGARELARALIEVADAQK